MRVADLDLWGLRDSFLHRRDPRIKIISAILLIAALSRGGLLYPAVVILCGVAVANLPVGAVLVRSAVVLPFALSFAIASLLSGHMERAVYVTGRSYLSAACVVVLVGSTPMSSILHALRRLGAPVALLEVIHFVYQYLALVNDQAQRMTVAAASRGARRNFAAVAGSVGVLFAKSYHRADAVHRAMLARGYDGRFPQRQESSLRLADALVVVVAGLPLLATFV